MGKINIQFSHFIGEGERLVKAIHFPRSLEGRCESPEKIKKRTIIPVSCHDCEGGAACLFLCITKSKLGSSIGNSWLLNGYKDTSKSSNVGLERMAFAKTLRRQRT